MNIGDVYSNRSKPDKTVKIMQVLAGRVKYELTDGTDSGEASELTWGKKWKLERAVTAVDQADALDAAAGDPQPPESPMAHAIEPVDTSRIEYSGDPADTIDGQHGDVGDPGDESDAERQAELAGIPAETPAPTRISLKYEEPGERPRVPIRYLVIQKVLYLSCPGCADMHALGEEGDFDDLDEIRAEFEERHLEHLWKKEAQGKLNFGHEASGTNGEAHP